MAYAVTGPPLRALISRFTAVKHPSSVLSTSAHISLLPPQSDAGEGTPSPEAAPVAGPSSRASRGIGGGEAPLQPSGPICSFGPRLAFTCFPSPAPDAARLNAKGDAFWFTVDQLLLYLSFFQDTGPLNCACLYRFCLHLHSLIEDTSPTSPSAGKRIILYSSDEPDKKANAALLMALYCMIVLRWSPADALHPLAQLELQPFRDAGYARADFHLSIQNVLFGVKRAIDLRLLKLDEFDLKEYETYEKVENGDYNWLSPGFIAFASPSEPGYTALGTPALQKSMPTKMPKAFRNILDRFEKVNVKLVIRLNKKLYDEHHFLEHGMEHREMYFDDGTNPPMPMVREFIDICDKVIEGGGVVAVHCKAGLGRTGTLIGAYLIYKYGFTAEEAIGFMRIMRPGTCVGPQQHFLYENQLTWVRWAATDAALATRSPKVERPITPPSDQECIAAPRTPTQHNRAGSVAVPGQPRKTPGAKSRHMVAEPETRVVGGDDMVDEALEDEMQLIPTPETEKAVKVENEEVVTRVPGSRGGATTRAAAASSSTRIAKPRPRPLSALSDNRHVDRLGGAASGGGKSDLGFKRSKGVKDLGTLFEGLAQAAGGSSDGGRYNLRGGASRSISSSGSAILGQASSGPAPAVSTNVHASPSRLPTRVSAKRRGTVKERGAAGSGSGSQGNPSCHSEASGGIGSHLIVGTGRSVRRRRSSLGAADVLA